ncbi:MAG: aldehyde dehydrogenase family protein [Anaerolineae bacterium]|nr:aldehyde dehydrogenase family protein [Anaerolineae bacterium]
MSTHILNPFDGTVVGTVPQLSEAEVKNAIQTAAAFKEEFAQMPAYEKAGVLTRTAEIIQREAENLSTLIARESGKPLRYARGEVRRAVETFTFAADEARRLRGETIPMDAAAGGIGKVGYYIRVPIGIVAAITPFNFPLNLVAHKVAPAIAAGCPIVLKPAPATPLTAIRLMEIMREAGLAPAAFQVLTGDADVGKWLTTNDHVDMISFTGSPAVANQISKVSGLRRTTFELGGNAAVIVDEGTTITDALVNRLLVGGFAYSGQVCISVQRMYIHRSLYESLKERLIARTQQLIAGNPLDEATEIGPLISESAAERIESWVQEGISAGATVLCGGRREGKFYQPTLMEDVPEHLNLMCSEVFGPVVMLVPYDDFSEAIAQTNDSEYGLQAGVYTPDLTRAIQATREVHVGGVIINDVPTFRVDHMPYGGSKHSGVGREGPQFAIQDMTEIRMVVINPS